MALIFKKISVIGLGLIGTSILHAINAKEDKGIITLAYDINPDHRDLVLKMNANFPFSYFRIHRTLHLHVYPEQLHTRY